MVFILILIAFVALILGVLSTNRKNDKYPKHFVYWDTEVEALSVEAPIGGFKNDGDKVNAFLNRERVAIKATKEALYINGEKVTLWEFVQEKDGVYFLK